MAVTINGSGTIDGSGGFGAWTSYTPTLGGTGWAIGNGTAVGKYVQIGKLVNFWAQITLGTTSTAGASGATVSLPVSAGPSNGNGSSACQLVDSSASARYLGSSLWASATTQNPVSIGTGGAVALITTSAPFVWATSDQIIMTGFYEAA